MTNGNESIYVSNLIQVGENEWRHASSEIEYRNSISRKTTTGLTKREEFAARAMIGLLSNHTMIDNDSKTSIEWAAKTSVLMSDALISELNKPTTNG